MLGAFKGARRASNNSQAVSSKGGSTGSGGGGVGGGLGSSNVDYGYEAVTPAPAVISSSSSSDWSDAPSDKESLQSWANQQREKENEENDDLLASEEENKLRRWFLLITVVMILGGVGVCVFTYYYLSRQEREAFETSFDTTAQAVLSAAESHMQTLERALQSKSQQLTTFSVFTASRWPFVTLPDFAVQGHNFLVETQTEVVAWAPIIEGQNTLTAWESYSTYMLQNSGWFSPEEIETAMRKMGLLELDDQPTIDVAMERNNQIIEEGGNETGLYVPVWQLSPWLYNSWILNNVTEQFEASINLLIETQQPVWSRFFNIDRPAEPTLSNHTDDAANYTATESTSNTTTSRLSSFPDNFTVASFLFQPVFRTLPRHDVTYHTVRDISVEQTEIVAVYMAAIQWDRFLEDLLPPGTANMDIVLSNPFGQTLTYRVNSDVTDNANNEYSVLLGEGDLHESKYDDMLHSTSLTATIDEWDMNIWPYSDPPAANKDPVAAAERNGVGNGSSNATEDELSSPFQPVANPNFQITVYPTQDFEDAFASNEPLVLTLVLSAVVFVAIGIFYFYSQMMYNRQQRLVDTANKTARVVKSLFPSNVRDRIMQEAEESALKGKAKRKRGSQNGAKGDKMDDQSLAADEIERRSSAGSSAGNFGMNNSSSGRGTSIIGSVASIGSRYSRTKRGRQPETPSLQSPAAMSALTQRSSDFGTPVSRNNSMGMENPYGSKPIADHHSSTTVLFADMVGFTAWSSVREPTQVFQLLETIYHSFDKVAKKRGVFKVETIGDCYVAVCGLPEPRPDHAIAMAYFANDCLRKMGTLTKKLEISLGPDTGDLSIRVGLHSGPVTAGVLRGEKSRFQLFGDTVNTAARMESNGKKNCIHVSEATAKLLEEAGKSRWLTKREDKIFAKGKGEMQTYWLEIRQGTPKHAGEGTDRRSSGDTGGAATDDGTNSAANSLEIIPAWEKDVSERDNPSLPAFGDRFQRLVDWNVDQLVKLLTKVVIQRTGRSYSDTEVSEVKGSNFDLRTESVAAEVTEVITFPKPTIADILVGSFDQGAEEVSLDSNVVQQLHDLMTSLASDYGPNPFHNFAHASHVAMAVTTWLSRITPPTADQLNNNFYEEELQGDWKNNSFSKQMYALQYDAFTHFSLLFAALVHDLDHTGVPNSQLIKEQSQVASLYDRKSIHEQESVDSAFETLMDEKYNDLRDVLFTNEDEFYRFRQIVINAVMATDILDEKVMAKQSVRWGCLFRDHEEEEEGDDISYSEFEPENEGDQKASIVVERLLVVSNIAHTMQHWYVYRKWNEKLFEELYIAWKKGRADKDPSIDWYENELEFFDKYVIPLASKMKQCELFDSSSEESLRYAKSNRDQWENTGREEVASMVERCRDITFDVPDSFDIVVTEGQSFETRSSASQQQQQPSRRDRPTLQRGGMDVSMATMDTVFWSRRSRP